jgi:radical SAM superfamily enzyme YgiQ (UPF0313 family)
MKPYPPLGLLYLSSYLKAAGFSVEIFDSTFSTRDALFSRLATERGVLGIYTNLMTRGPVVAIAQKAKELGWTVVLGGPESANYPGEYLSFGADAVVIGEGEETLRDLIPALAENGPHRLHEVAGVVFRDEAGDVVTNPERAKIANLDSLPFPDREAIDHQLYLDTWRKHHGAGSINLITARGCPYKCTWCSHAVFGFTHRRRSAKNAADEVEAIRDRYNPEQVWYADDVFTMSHSWLFAYNQELKRRNIRLPFETISRADRMMNEEVLSTLAEMGCYRVWIGSESGSQRILDAMKRGVTTDEVDFAVKAARRHGIQTGMFLMWGYDGETVEDIEATIDHVKRTNPDVFFTTVSYPIKNTAYFEAVASRVVLDQDWLSASDRDYKVKGRPSRAYYKQADQWLKNSVAAHRLLDSDPVLAAEKEVAAEAARRAMLGLAGEVEA